MSPAPPGPGFPQVMAALDPGVEASQRTLFVSMKLTLAKDRADGRGACWPGCRWGREGPSCADRSGHHAAAPSAGCPRAFGSHRAWPAGLLVVQRGSRAAFNAPLAGVMFAIEELSRTPEQRSNGPDRLRDRARRPGRGYRPTGTQTYFGVIRVAAIDLSLLGPGLLTALACGAAGRAVSLAC